jgi:hypothetical protein
MRRMIAFTEPTKKYHYTFRCSCGANLWIPKCKAGQVVWCLRCGQHWHHNGRVSLRKVTQPGDRPPRPTDERV